MKSNHALRTKTSLRHKIKLVLFGLFLFFILLEIGLRLGGFIYLALQEHRNQVSLRQKGEFRILCLGDSMTAGGEDPYPGQLEGVLNQRNIGIQFSVINKAVPSTTTSMILLQLEKNILKYKPHMLYAQAPFSKAYSWVRYFTIYKLVRLLWLRGSIKIKQYLSPAHFTLRLKKCYAENVNFMQGEDTSNKPSEVNSKDERAHIELGKSYVRQGNYLQAEESFKKALKLNPRSDDAYLWRGRMYYESFKNNTQAVTFFQKAIELNPRNADAYIELAGIYVTEGNYIQAKELLSKLIAITPEDERTQRGLAVLNAEINKHNSGKILSDNITSKSQKSCNLITYQNYLKLKQILDSRGIQLVCVQYPICSIEPLKKIFEGQEGVIFVDNEQVFKDALKKEPYKEYFTDMFAGDFGHCTRKGNRLLAENIANVIMKEHFYIK